MYHSITFGDKNTWDDWKLVPETQPIISPPSQKTNYIDIPGANGSLDMSEILTGYPLFNNREGSFTFIVLNKQGVYQPYENRKKLAKVAEDIMEYLHGRSMKMILEDDPLYYYEGRFTVSSVSPEEDFSTIEISYNVGPYKWSVYNSVDTNWLWDPFNFESGVIYKGLYSNINVNNSYSLTIPGMIWGVAPIQPTFYMQKNNSSAYWYVNVTCDGKYYQSGNITSALSYKFDDFVSTGKDVAIYAYCSSGGKLSINFRPGRL